MTTEHSHVIESERRGFSHLLFLLTITAIFLQDLPLQSIFGTIARSPIVFIAPLIFIILLLEDGKFKLFTIARYYWNYYLITVITSIFLLFFTVVFVTKGEWMVYSEFFPFKFIRASIYNLMYFLTAYNLSVLTKRLSIGSVYKILRNVFYIITIYGLLQLVIKYPLPFLHYVITSEYQTRIVMTNSEPSLTFPMYTVLAACVMALRLYLNKPFSITILLSGITIALLLLIQSKAGLFFFIFAGLLSLRKNFNIKIAITLLLVIIPIIYIIFTQVIPALIIDIELFASFSTRSTTFIASFLSLFKYPFGEGYGTYLYYFPQLLEPVNNSLSGLLNVPLSTAELDDMINTGVNLPGKSGIPNEIIFNGFTAVFFFIALFRYGIRQSKLIHQLPVRMIMLSVLIYLIFTFVFGAIMETAYYFLLPFIVSEMITAKQCSFEKTADS